MAKLDRKDIKIFGNDNATDQIVQFGSTRSGSINPSKDPDVLQGLSNYLQGWSEGVIASTGVPPFEEFNALQYLITRELSYLQQAGFPEYSATTEYFIGKSIVREPEGTKLYISLTDNNIGNPLTDMVNWQLLIDLSGDTLIDLNVSNKVNFAPNTATISAGIIDYIGANMLVDTQSGAATDDLETINGGVEGDIITIQTVSSSRDVVIKNTGNIRPSNNIEVTLTTAADTISFKKTAGDWIETAKALDNDIMSPQDVTIKNKFSLSLKTEIISAGAINYTASNLRVGTEGSSPTDDLETINSGIVGDILIIEPVSSSQDITIKHAVGNIRLFNDRDVTMVTAEDRIVLMKNNSNNWIELSRTMQNDFRSNNISTSSFSYLPNGYIMQRGIYTANAHAPTIIFDEAFSGSATYSVIATTNTAASRFVTVSNKTATSFIGSQFLDSGATSVVDFEWIAIGY